MKTRPWLLRCSVSPVCPFASALACAIGLGFSTLRAAELPPPNTFLLSGKLQQANVPAAGVHDFRFQLYDRETGGQVVAGTRSVSLTQPVNAGDWQVVLDVRQFAAEAPDLDGLVRPPIGSRLPSDGAAHTANALNWRVLQENWLEIAVRRQGVGEFVPLTPRQRLTAVPGAVVAQTADHALVAGTVAEGGVDARALAPGAITAEKFSVGAINNAALANLAITTPKIAPLTVVRSLNGLQDDVTLAAGTGVSLSAAGNTLTINSTATGSGTPLPNGNFLGVDNDNQFGGSASFGVIGGGQSTKISDENTHSTLGGGQLNRIYERSGHSFLGGGYNHQVGPDAPYATLGGGHSHILTNAHSATIAGGSQNVAGGDYATVGGGSANFSGPGGTVAGGGGNRAEGANAAVGGGVGNLARSAQATIGGGNNSVVETSPHGTIAGGMANSLTNSGHGFIGGGEQNRLLEASYSAIGGGLLNSAGTPYSAIIGGEGNRTEGIGGYATVLGGSFNLASGTHSLAAGHRAQAIHPASFIWNAWPGDVFASERDGEFAAKAYGGFRFVTGGADVGAGDITLDAGNSALRTSGKSATFSFGQAFNLTAGGGVNFTTGGQGLIVDGERVGTGGGGGGLLEGSVTTAKLADAAVNVSKLAISGTPGEGKLLSYSGGTLNWAPAPAGNTGVTGGWALGGNAGTDPDVNVLGTTDDRPLVIRVENVPALRMEWATNLLSVVQGFDAETVALNVTLGRGFIRPGVVGAIVGGGLNGAGPNSVFGSGSVVLGGDSNSAGNPAADPNHSNGGSFVGGGAVNSAWGHNSVVVGGNANLAAGGRSSIVGGLQNAAYGDGDFVGGGLNNKVSGGNWNQRFLLGPSAIAGGRNNIITNAISAFIGGGWSNRIGELADFAVIGGGLQNEVAGAGSMIVGGISNLAAGTRSFAAGTEARANHTGSFVWNDGSAGGFASARDHEFAVHAAGGARFETGGGGVRADKLSITGNGTIESITGGNQTQPQLHLGQTVPGEYVRVFANTPQSFWSFGAGGPNGWFSFYVPGQSPANTVDTGADRLIITPNGEVGVGSDRPFAQFHVRGSGGFDRPQIRATQLNPQDFARLRLETGQQSWDMSAGPDGSLRFFSGGADRVVVGANGTLSATAINQTSDRNAKQDFKPVDARSVLAKVAALPISEWQFKTDTEGSRHVGPMAQDFREAFGLGTDERHIATVDADGVALAAIQGLNEVVEEQRAALARKDTELRELRDSVAELKALMTRLAAQGGGR